MTMRLLLGAALALAALAFGQNVSAAGSSSSPSATPASKLAPFKERLAAAESVQVQTEILGLELDSSLETAHAKLDPLVNPANVPNKEAEDGESGEREQKVLWQLAKTDYSSVFVKADDKDRVTYIMGLLRPGKEIPFEKIGQVDKAPMQSDKMVAWDIVRPNRPLMRLVARGSNARASSIVLFIVKRAQDQN